MQPYASLYPSDNIAYMVEKGLVKYMSNSQMVFAFHANKSGMGATPHSKSVQTERIQTHFCLLAVLACWACLLYAAAVGPRAVRGAWGEGGRPRHRCRRRGPLAVRRGSQGGESEGGKGGTDWVGR